MDRFNIKYNSFETWREYKNENFEDHWVSISLFYLIQENMEKQVPQTHFISPFPV